MTSTSEPLPLRQRLAANAWFRALPAKHFETLLSGASERTWDAGAIIFREGEPTDFLYLLLEGAVALEIHLPARGRQTILTLGPNEVLGWSAMIPAVHLRTATARALEPTRAASFDAAALRAACESDHDLGYYIYRRLANVIAARLTATRLQLLDLYASPTSSVPS
jgi:CRP/FNR family cyclic AMP-dependent transcriptional regulator